MKALFIAMTTVLLCTSGCGGSGKSSNLPKVIADNKTDTTNNNKVAKDLPIVIIGPSTVYINKEQKSSKHFSDDSECPLYGWGELLGEYVKHDKVFNYAQPGAGAGSFRVSPPSNAKDSELVLFGPNRDHYWAKTREKMVQLKEGILLIQFGGNDPRHLMAKYPNATNQDLGLHFKENIKFYIDEAKSLNFIPVLITSIEKRIYNDNKTLKKSRGDFPKWINEIANEERLMVLELNKKSYKEYSRYSENEWKVKFADCYNKWQANAKLKEGTETIQRAKELSRENTHFEDFGAREVAGWIKELACQQSNTTLCRQFK